MNVASPAVGIVAILEASVDKPTGWTFKVGKLLDLPKHFAVLDTGGVGAEPRLSVDYPTVQILAVGDIGPTGYPDSYAAMRKVFDLLVGIPGGSAAFPELTSVTARGGIQWLGYSDKERPQWSLNLRLIMEPVPVAYGHRESL